MKIIGITGGIGSGKSTVSRILGDMGAKVMDADTTAKGMIKKGERAYREVADFFGEAILLSDGEIDRKKLAEIVFNDAEKLKILNEITHKYVTEAFRGFIQQEKQADENCIIVLDVPIPIEDGFLDTVDEVWVVMADEEQRIGRIMSRSGYTREEAMSRLASQMDDIQYLKISQKVLWNDGNLKELKKKVEEFLNG